MDWKCDQCGYTFKLEPEKLPEKCPSFGQKCTFINVSCYTPDCCPTPDGCGIDTRIGKK